MKRKLTTIFIRSLSSAFVIVLSLQNVFCQIDQPDTVLQANNVKLIPFSAAPSAAQQASQMEWWHQAKFGMFIHWGLYSIPARQPWFMQVEKIPVEEYAKLAQRLNPTKFNADEWVRFAKDAGMKYIVITAKHHDGFAMYHSTVSPYNIMDATPFKRDPIKELAAACKKQGIKFGLYYSQAQDWHHKGGSSVKGFWDPAQNGDFGHYLHTISIPQIRELLNNYDPAVIWFDTPHEMTPEYAREIEQVVRSIRPQTIINSRLLIKGRVADTLSKAHLDGLRDLGVDYLSYSDCYIPALPMPSPWGRSWETCMTLNESWAYTENDQSWKSPKSVLQMLSQVVNKGGNFLLNFGPNAEGLIPAESVGIMQQVGAWLQVNSEAIYGAGPSDLRGSGTPIPNKTQRKTNYEFDWVATSRPAVKETGQPAKIYLHIFKWPAGRFEVKGMKSRVTKAYLLNDTSHSSLRFSQQGEMFSVELSGNAPDPIAIVVCLECATE